MSSFKKLWRNIGIAAFWMGLPVIYLYLRSSERTRIIITSGDTLLLVRPWLGRGTWELPGGGIGHGEKPVAAAARELHEEVGIRVKPSQLQFLFMHSSPDMGLNIKRHVFMMDLPLRTEFSSKHLEISEARWVGKDEVMSYLLEPASRDIIKTWTTRQDIV